MVGISARDRFSPNKTFAVSEKHLLDLILGETTGRRFSNLLVLGTSINVQKEQSLDLSAGTLCNVNKKISDTVAKKDDIQKAMFKVDSQMMIQKNDKSSVVETVTTSNELDLLFGPLFDEYFNGENQVVLKSSAVTTTDASNKRQQQPDSTSSTSTLATTVTANGNFDL
ncbi:hypothetical protein Tco_1135726 [Tanacetum coccineum]